MFREPSRRYYAGPRSKQSRRRLQAAAFAAYQVVAAAALVLVMFWGLAGVLSHLNGDLPRSSAAAGAQQSAESHATLHSSSSSSSSSDKPLPWKRPAMRGLAPPCDGSEADTAMCMPQRTTRRRGRGAGAEELVAGKERAASDASLQAADGTKRQREGADTGAVLDGLQHMGSKDESVIRGDAALKAMLARLRQG